MTTAEDRFRRAAGTLPDSAMVTVRVGDLHEALSAFDKVDALESEIDHAYDRGYDDASARTEDQHPTEIERLNDRIDALKQQLADERDGSKTDDL
jgi:hypothetical protein